MKKAISFIVLILLTLNFLASPFHLLNLREKSTWFIHKSEFKKKKIRTDSILVNNEGGGSGAMTSSSDTSIYYLYYDNGKFISVQDNAHALFHSKKEVIKTRSILKYVEEHNDSLLIWYHPTLNGQIALPSETEMNTNGFLIQILLNILLLLVAMGSLIWLIKKIKNNRNEEN